MFRYLDIDWANDLHDMKSTIRYIFKLGSSLIMWWSKKQPCIAFSFIKAKYMAKYMALNIGTKEVVG
jgi:hypothetical protein